MTFLSFKVVWQASCPKIPKRLLNNLPDFTLVSRMPKECPIRRHNNTKSSFMLNSRQNTEFKHMMLLRSFSEFDWFMVQCAFFHSHVPAHRDLCVTVDGLFTRILTSFLLCNNFLAKNLLTLLDTIFQIPEKNYYSTFSEKLRVLKFQTRYISWNCETLYA